jgi:hypothetical protein
VDATAAEIAVATAAAAAVVVAADAGVIKTPAWEFLNEQTRRSKYGRRG